MSYLRLEDNCLAYLNVRGTSSYESLRAHPDRWVALEWKKTYHFRSGDVKVVEKKDDTLERKFPQMTNSKKGFNLKNLQDPEA